MLLAQLLDALVLLLRFLHRTADLRSLRLADDLIDLFQQIGAELFGHQVEVAKKEYKYKIY